jgi:hypothetical protein
MRLPGSIALFKGVVSWLRCRSVFALSKFLPAPVRIADEFWLGVSPYETSASQAGPFRKGRRHQNELRQ